MLILFLFYAALVEAVNELTFGRIFGEGKQVPSLAWVLPLSALAIGVTFGFLAKVMLISWAATNVGVAVDLPPEVDYIGSGILVSAGSKYLHQLLSSFAPEKSPAPEFRHHN